MQMLGMSTERYEILSKPGNMSELCERISKESGLDFTIVVQRFPAMVKMLTTKQAYMMKAHYLWRQSIITIKFETGVSSYKDIERTLERAEKKMIELCSLIVSVSKDQIKEEINDDQ